MSATLNIAALAQRTGVPADTLRKWELRYGVLRPTRTPGGQRRYDEVELARVEWLRDRLEEGYRIGEAATMLAATTAPARTPAELRDALLTAIRESDVQEIERLLDQVFALHRLEQALVRIVQPVLEQVGKGWESGHLSVAQEHLATAAIRGRLERMLADARGGVRGVAVLACVPGERHELGVLLLATLLRADGWQVAYLGADAPLADSYALAEQLSASFIGLSIAMRERANDIKTKLTRASLPTGCVLVLGGRGASARFARSVGARHVNGDLRRSVRELRKLSR